MKHCISLLLALALLLTACLPAVFAADGAEAALAAAEAEFQALKDLGLLQEDIVFVSSPENVQLYTDGESYWVSNEMNDAYSIVMLIDKESLTLTGMTVTASAQEDDEPLADPAPFVSGNREYAYYDIFDRVFAPDMTIGKCAAILAEYYACEEEPRVIFIDTEDNVIDEEPDAAMPLGDIAYYYNRVLRISTERVRPVYAECSLFPGMCYFHFGPAHSRG